MRLDARAPIVKSAYNANHVEEWLMANFIQLGLIQAFFV